MNVTVTANTTLMKKVIPILVKEITEIYFVDISELGIQSFQ